MKPVVLMLILLLFLTTGCKYDCKTPSVVYWEPGYDSAQTAVIIVRSYERTAAAPFSKLLFTTITGSSVHTTVPGPDADTIAWTPEITYIDMRYDMEVELPAVNRTYRLRDFSVHQNYEKNGIAGGYKGCSNTISYFLDDVLYQQTPDAAGMNFPPDVAITLH
jgi:hypothetical protein